MSQEKVRIDVVKLIEFYDQKVKNIKKPASSISGIIGEDLIAGLFKHYLENQNRGSTDEVIIIDESIKANGINGKMLDRWILHHTSDGQKIAYQTEIKNWSVHSLGGKTFDQLELKNPLKNILDNAQKNLKKNCLIDKDGKIGFIDKSVGKVLLNMKPDKRVDNHIIKPLICFWMPICSDDDIKAFFVKDCSSDTDLNPFYNERKFNSVSFFSASIYLRELILKNPGVNDLSIEIYSTNIKQRLDILQSLIKEY
jgi:hypothetical protein